MSMFPRFSEQLSKGVSMVTNVSRFSCHVVGDEGICTEDGREVQRCHWPINEMCPSGHPIEDVMQVQLGHR